MRHNGSPLGRKIIPSALSALLIACSTLLTGCASTGGETAMQQNTAELAKPTSTQSASDDDTQTPPPSADEAAHLLIFIYPESGAVSHGQYFHLPLADNRAETAAQ